MYLIKMVPAIFEFRLHVSAFRFLPELLADSLRSIISGEMTYPFI